MSPAVSLILPAFNEERLLHRTVTEATRALSTYTQHYEIIIVDDGSTDSTRAIATALHTHDPLRIHLISLPRNRGKGHALKTGMSRARGDVLIYCDADMPFDMSNLAAAIDALHATSAHIVAAYRTNRNVEPPLRRASAIIYNALVRATFGVDFTDVSFCLKALRREAYERVAPDWDSPFFDAGLLVRAVQLDMRIAWIPVVHTPHNERGSTMLRPTVVLRMLADLHRLRRKSR